MAHNFSNDDLLIANYHLSVLNNTMLKIVLSNQVAIMKKLDIPRKVSNEVLASVMPKAYKPPVPDNDLVQMFKEADHLYGLTDIQMNEFVFDVKRIKAEVAKDPDLGIKLNDQE